MSPVDNIDEDAPVASAKTPFLTAPQWLLFGGLLLAVIILSVAMTVMLFQPGTDRARDSQSHLIAQIGALEDRMTYYERQLNQMSSSVERLTDRQTSAERASLPPALVNRLLEQERNFQQFIVALKEGMRELSHMVQGSRDWLELYSDELDDVLKHSEQRARDLESWDNN